MIFLITGAAEGIGAAVTALAVQQGHQVIATDISIERLHDRCGDHLMIRQERLNVAEPDEWERLIAKLEHEGVVVDFLINAAGVLRSGQTGKLTAYEIDLTLDVNVKGVIFGTNAVAAMMKKRQSGHIINIGSMASLYATPGNTLYATSKFAVRGFSIASAGDLKPHNVAVTLFGPGPVKTNMLEQQRGDLDSALTFAASRALSTDEVAQAILGPVLRKRPVEYFLPFREGIRGKICNAFPRYFLNRIEKARARGVRNFSSSKYL